MRNVCAFISPSYVICYFINFPLYVLSTATKEMQSWKLLLMLPMKTRFFWIPKEGEEEIKRESSIFFTFWYCVCFLALQLTSGFAHLFLKCVTLKHIGNWIPRSGVSRNQGSASGVATNVISASITQNFISEEQLEFPPIFHTPSGAISQSWTWERLDRRDHV